MNEYQEFLVNNKKAIRDQIYNFILAYKLEHNGISPTIEEIASGVNRSKSNTFLHINGLKHEGRIDFLGEFMSRNIIIPGLEVRMTPSLCTETTYAEICHEQAFSELDLHKYAMEVARERQKRDNKA